MKFIESNSLIGSMTRFALSRAVQDLREIGAPRPLYLGVATPTFYLISSAFITGVGNVGSLDLPPLILKIGAGDTRKFRSRLIPMMAQAHDRGMHFALSTMRPTDVGPELPAGVSFEMVKIGRDVLRMDSGKRSRQISALTRSARRMGTVIIVEGVEIAAYHNVARVSHAEFRQGFLYSSTLDASRLKAFLEAVNAPS